MVSSPVPLIDRFSSLTARYDALICDVWGVLHNGARVSPEAEAALGAAREAGLAVVMLTNAPRMPVDVAGYIRHLGGTRPVWDEIVSSGGVTRKLLAERGARPFYHLGPQRDTSLYTGLAARPVALEEADYVLCTGLFDDETETAEDYRESLAFMLTRKMDLICANPDSVVERGHRLIPCAGAIADLYETMGGPVTWIGKPHPLVYDAAKAAIETRLGRPVEKSRILGIGDAIRTDVSGALAYGIDCLFVLDGIHSAELGELGRDFSPAAVDAFLARAKVHPTYATVSLKG